MVGRINKIRNKTIENFKIEEEDIAPDIKKDLQGKPLILHDSGVFNPVRFVLFFSKIGLEFFKLTDVFLIGSTFNIVPTGFTQLVFVHGVVCGKTYPLCFFY
ncbi:hypothetical protein CDIK_1367 [Cucumispora dikerogammari]|nr:hypothetical protein CDIK_1367 [Cucumispora dikerogammari]